MPEGIESGPAAQKVCENAATVMLDYAEKLDKLVDNKDFDLAFDMLNRIDWLIAFRTARCETVS